MRPRVTQGGRVLLVQSDAAVPPTLSLAAEMVDLDVEACRPRDAADVVMASTDCVLAIVAEPDALATVLALSDARPGAVKVLLADERSLPLAVEALNAGGAVAIGRLDGGVRPLATIIERALALSREREEQRRMVLALRAGLDHARQALAHAEERVVAVRGSIDVDTGLWDTMRLIERIEDEANRLQRYGTPFGVLGVNCAQGSATFEVAVGELLASFVRRVDVCTRRGPGDFVVVCPSTDDQGMRRLVVRFSEAIVQAGLGPVDGGSAVVVYAVGFEKGPLRSDDVLAALSAERRRLDATSSSV